MLASSATELTTQLSIMAATKLCIICGYVGQPRLETKGTFIMEVFLWLIFLLPGLIYSIWRLTTRYDACPECAAANMIPTSSPVAQKLLQEHRQPQPAQNTQRRGSATTTTERRALFPRRAQRPRPWRATRIHNQTDDCEWATLDAGLLPRRRGQRLDAARMAR